MRGTWPRRYTYPTAIMSLTINNMHALLEHAVSVAASFSGGRQLTSSFQFRRMLGLAE